MIILVYLQKEVEIVPRDETADIDSIEEKLDSQDKA